jgi:hypothetical protein
VPAAWLVTAATVVGVVSEHALFVAHVVMSVLLVAFLLGSRDEMVAGALLVWKVIILVGTPVTLAGVAGFLARDGVIAAPTTPLLAIALYGWILLPAVGLVLTGQRVRQAVSAYAIGAGGCVAGAVAVGLAESPSAVAAGIGVVGLGQTIGIIAATVTGSPSVSPTAAD